MKRAAIRFLYVYGAVATLSLHFLTKSLSYEEHIKFSESISGAVLFLSVVVSILFYFSAMMYACFDILRNKREHWEIWLLFVFLIPILGSYIYFEKYLLAPIPKKSKQEGEVTNITLQEVFSEYDPVVRWLRILGGVIDYSMLVILLVVCTRLFGSHTADGTFEIKGFAGHAVVSLVWLLLFPICEFFFGTTIAKAFLGLRVLMLSGSRVTLLAALQRHLLDFVDVVLVVIVFPMMKGGETPPQRLGDRWAKTVVIRRKLYAT